MQTRKNLQSCYDLLCLPGKRAGLGWRNFISISLGELHGDSDFLHCISLLLKPFYGLLFENQVKKVAVQYENSPE